VPRYSAHRSVHDVDLRRLEAALRDTVRGEVRLDPGSRGAYATDASNFRQVPLAVVVPRDVEDLAAAVAACRAVRAPVTHRGGGTSLAGQSCNVAVVIDSSKHVNRVGPVDPGAATVVAEPGAVLDRVQEAAAVYGLMVGPDPATHSRCTVGGMVGNDSCGTHSLTTGRTSGSVVALDVLTYDGTRLRLGPRGEGLDDARRVALERLRDRYADEIRARFPRISRRVSGYNLAALLAENGFDVTSSLVGTEGTCVTVLGATLRLVRRPRVRGLVVVGYDDVAAAADDVPRVLRHSPFALEGLDSRLLRYQRARGAATGDVLPSGSDFLLVDLVGETSDEVLDRARALAADLGEERCRVHLDDAAQQRVWRTREGALGAAAQPPGEPLMWAGWEDAAVPPERLGDYLRGFRALLDRYGYGAASFYGHFGEGCVHTRIPFDLRTADGVAAYRSFLDEAADLTVAHGGSLSGEHGDGQQRGPLLERMYGARLVEAFREFKAVWDPDGLMNPGKVVDPVREFAVDENLRLGPDYAPWDPPTELALSADGGSLARASLRCVGVGLCRREGGGTMCPSYMVTKEEEHSTRGRARVLFEMLEGEVVTDGWRSQDVYDALDLCLSCKGCKADCPVGVDMAAYKAEFLAHHWRGRIRPRHAYAMGLVMYAARAGSRAPRLANLVLSSRLVKRAAGVAPDRQAPRLAERTFRSSWRARPASGRPRVVLLADTFTDRFEPSVGHATASVLDAAGFDVVVPQEWMCCGRPLFDYGMVRHARRLYRRTLDVLREEIRAGTPVVVPEPSCCASFRDELVELLPHDQDARRLASLAVTLGEALTRHAPDWRPPPVDGRLLVQRHCHHQAVMGTDPELGLLARTGAEVDVCESGCCGLAGSWGYERDKFELSMQIGERVLLPAVRGAPPGTVVVADGFSCRSQIAQGTGTRALHLAELLASRLR
jgi:FAD/FMN-containing dehydrogenase/Fe-S oxidoreductase